MPENNNQEFDAAEAALGSINTTPSCEILEHPQLRNLKRPAERTKSLETCSNGNSSKRDVKQCGAQQSGNVKDEQSALSGIVNLHHKQDQVRAPWTFEKDKGGVSKDISLSDEKASRVKTDRAMVLLQNDAYEEQKSCSIPPPKQGAFHGSNSEVEGKLIVKPELADFDRSNIYELEFMVYGYIRRTKGIVGLELQSLENDTWSFTMFYNQDFDWPIQSSHIIEGIKCSITTQRDGPWNYLPD